MQKQFVRRAGSRRSKGLVAVTAAAAAAVGGTWAPVARAQTYALDPTKNGAQPWDTSTAIWDNGTNTPGAYDDTFANGSSASSVIALLNSNAATTLTTSLPITVNQIQFTGANAFTTVAGSVTNTITFAGTGANTIDVITGGTGTISAVLAGTTGLTKTGAGTLVLSGANIYTGGTTISGGTVSVAAVGNLSTGAISLNGGTLQSTAAVTFSQAITVGSAGGAFDQNAKQKSQIAALAGTGTFTRAASANGTTRGLGAGGGVTNDLQLTGTATFNGPVVLNGGQTEGSTGSIGTGAITINSGAELSGSYSNAITVNAGGSISAIGGTSTFSGPITVNGNFTVGLGDFYQATSRNLIVSGNLTGTGTITPLNAATTTVATGGGQTLFLNGNNSGYTSAITVPAGYNFSFGTANSYGTGGVTINSTATALAGIGVGYDFGATVPSFTNGRTGTTTGGVFGINAVLPAATSLNLATLGGGGMFLGSQSTGTYAATTLGADAGTYRLGGGLGTLTLSGVNALTGAAAVIAGDTRTGGTGTVVLAAANDYTGTTTVNGGTTLQVADGNALGSTATGTTVNAGGALALSGGVTVNEPLTVTGTSSTAGTTNLVNGLVNVSGTNTYAGTITATTGSNNVRVSTTAGTLNLPGAINLSGGGVATGLVFAGAGTVNQTGTISGGGSVIGTSTGTTTLSGTNTFTGKVQNQQGTFSTPSLNNVGTNGLTPLAASGLGVPSSAANGVIELGSGTTAGALTYTGTGETTDRQIVLLGTTGGGTITQSGTGLLKFLTNVNASGAGSKTLTLQGSTTGTGEFAGVIGNNTTANVTALAKAGSGTWTLSGANTYSGATSINQGTLVISSLANVNAGTATSLGNPTTVAQGTINLGSGTTTSVSGVLVYTGTGSTSDRVVNLASNTANGTLDQSGTGTFQVGAVTATGAGTKTLVLQGSTAGVGVVAGAIANNSSTNLTNVTKSGLGTWTLAGANTYTGTTTVSTGLLRVNGNSSAATGAVAVNTGGALGGTGTVGGAVTVAAGGNVDLRDGTVGTLSLASTLALNGTAALTNNLYFDLGNASNSLDKIAATGAVTTATANAVLVSFNQLAGAPIPDGTYTLISTAAATGNTTTGFALATTQSGGHTYSLTTAATGNILQVTVGTAATGAASSVWGGTASTSWAAAGNWYTDAASGTAGAVPGVGTNVSFYTTTPAATNLSTVLNGDYEINSLTFLATATSPVTIAAAASSTNALTIDAGTANGNAAGNGISQLAAATHTISARVGIGAAQTWTVAAGGGLTLSGLVFDTGPGFTLTKAGAGTLTLSGTANTFTGDINVTAGVLAFAGNGGANGDPLSLGAGNKAITITNNAVVRPTSSANPTSTNTKRFVVGAGGATFDVLNGVTFSLDDATQFSGTGDLTVTGAGTGVVYLNNQPFNYSGNVAVNSGTLRLGTNSVLGTSAGRTITVNAGGTLDTNTTVTAANVPLGVTLNGGTLSAAAASGSFAQAVTLAANSNVSAGTGFTETVAGNVTGAFALTKLGAGTTVLSGTNTYGPATGAATVVSAGTLTAAKTAALPDYATAGRTSVASGATLNLNVGGTGEFATADVAAVFAGGGGAFASGSTISFDTTNAGGSFTAPAVTPTPSVAALNLQKIGTGTLVLPAANGFGTGATTILAGTVSATSGTANPLGTGSLTLGSVGGADNALNLGTSSQTFSGLRVNNSSATTASTVTVAAGQTLTFTGNVLVGPDAPTATLPSKLTVNGGGTLAVSIAANGLFLVGGTNASTTSGQVLNNATLDLTGLASANINVSVTGSVRVANQMNANTSGIQATLLLPTPAVAPGTAVTTVLANNFNVGDSGSNGSGAGQTNSIVLGTGLTTLNVNNVNVGTGGRDLGSLTFAAGNGTLTLQGAASTPTSRVRATALNVGTGGATTGVAPGTGVTNVVDLSGHNADLFVTTVTIGSQNRLTNRTDTVTFDSGSFDAGTVVVGTNSGTASTAAGTFTPTWTSTLNLAGGTTTIGSGGVDLGFGQTAATSGTQLGTKTITANLNVSGGTVTVANNTTFGAAIRMSQSTQASVVADRWDPLESTCRHASLSIL